MSRGLISKATDVMSALDRRFNATPISEAVTAPADGGHFF